MKLQESLVTNNRQAENIFKKLSEAVSRERKLVGRHNQSRRIRYSAYVRNMVMELFSLGYNAYRIAKSCGISTPTIALWRTKKMASPFRELKIVPNQDENGNADSWPQPQGNTTPKAEFFFPSGVKVVVDISSLDQTLIARFLSAGQK